MGKRIDIQPGDRFSRLTIIKEVEKKSGMRQFHCKCDCGKEGIYRFTAMRVGKIKSCGCLRDEQNLTASLTHGRSKSSLYSSWHSMKQRCLNGNCRAYKHYGGRGIIIFEPWLEFAAFMEWALVNGYAEGLTIEREDVNGNYHPSNCKWITQAEQTKNKRNNVIIEFDGIKLCVKDWARRIGISNSAMQKRLAHWPLEKALTEPINIKYAS